MVPRLSPSRPIPPAVPLPCGIAFRAASLCLAFEGKQQVQKPLASSLFDLARLVPPRLASFFVVWVMLPALGSPMLDRSRRPLCFRSNFTHCFVIRVVRMRQARPTLPPHICNARLPCFLGVFFLNPRMQHGKMTVGLVPRQGIEGKPFAAHAEERWHVIPFKC